MRQRELNRKYFVQFVKLLMEQNKKIVAGLSICIIFASVCTTTAVYGNKILVDYLSKPISWETKIGVVLFVVLMIALLRFASSALNEAVSYLNTNLSERLGIQLQSRVQEKVSKIERIALEDPQYLDVVERAKSTLTSDSTKLLHSLILVVQNIMIFLIYTVMFASIRWYFPIIVLCFSIFGSYVSVKYGISTYFLKKSQSRVVRKSQYLEKLLINRESAKEIRCFHLTNFLIDRLLTIRKAVLKEEKKLVSSTMVTAFAGKILRFLGCMICALILGIEIFRGKSEIGDFVLIFSIGLSFGTELDILADELANIGSFLVRMDDLAKFEKMPEETGDREPLEKGIEIQFEHLSFSYPSSVKPVIQDISGCIPKGKITVLVGENGSGKTTFLNLIMGLYLPQSGEIRINGKDLNKVRFTLREKTACVFQNFNRYQMSLRDTLFLKPGDETRLDFQRICTGMLGFIRDLPNGLDTPLGQFDEGGIELSGGQWQRLAFARALLKPDSDLLIFDEPTAALDPMIESQIYENLLEYINGRTTIIASHRLSVCKFADEIIVFDHGAIVEHGSHQMLMDQGGLYYRMYSAQSSLYV